MHAHQIYRHLELVFNFHHFYHLIDTRSALSENVVH